MQPAASLDELRKRIAKYMQLEELREFHNQAQKEANGQKGKEKKERQVRSANREDRRRDNRGSGFSRYTHLTTERGRILNETLNVELIPPPRKASSPDNADYRKRCRYRYHRNNGHSTKECQTLKDNEEDLIQVEHLQRFVQGAQGTRRPHRWDELAKRRNYSHPRARDDHRPERQPMRDDPACREDPSRKNERTGDWEVMHTIIRGFADGGSSNNTRKKYLKAMHQVNTVSF